MPINVICPSCHARFQVSEKFAGKKGPCPKCKAPITIPAANEQIKIHERQHEGVRDTKGKLVLKPIKRQEMRVSPIIAAAAVIAALATVGIAWFLGKTQSPVSSMVLGVGALVVAPPLVLLGYLFLRDDELEPYRGLELVLRAGLCAAVYAATWGAYALVLSQMGPDEFEIWTLAIIMIPMVVAGAGTAMGSLDLTPGNAFFHYALYFLACVLLRVAMGLPALGTDPVLAF